MAATARTMMNNTAKIMSNEPSTKVIRHKLTNQDLVKVLGGHSPSVGTLTAQVDPQAPQVVFREIVL